MNNQESIVTAGDLSITYHIVAYAKKKAPHIKKIILKTAKIKQDEYPYGWLSNGKFANHNNYDVVRIFAHGWEQLTPDEQEKLIPLIQEMLEPVPSL